MVYIRAGASPDSIRADSPADYSILENALCRPDLEDFFLLNAGRRQSLKILLETSLSSITWKRLDRAASLKPESLLIRITLNDAPSKIKTTIIEAESTGLKTRLLLSIKPEIFEESIRMARSMHPRPVIMEIDRRSSAGRKIRIRPAAVEYAFIHANFTFEYSPSLEKGYLPPCTLPKIWHLNAEIWRNLLSSKRSSPNDVFFSCGTCHLGYSCRFNDIDSLTPRIQKKLCAVSVPEAVRRDRAFLANNKSSGIREDALEIPCIAPWTVMEIVDPAGFVNHCCTDWTIGTRGNVRIRSLKELWNGPNYRSARKRMFEDRKTLCRDICPRLQDGRFSQNSLMEIRGSPLFMENCLRLAEDLKMRRNKVHAKPLYITLCPTTKCNYNCIMCSYGRLPERKLPDSVIEQLTDFLPTLRSLTLLGGEPLLSESVMNLLEKYDREKFPDGGVDLVTNGSLLNRKNLSRLRFCAFGAIVISLNAGRSETYSAIHGGASMKKVLENIDLLLLHRDKYEYFGITLSFVVQPVASHELVRFGEIALKRNLDIRLLPLTPNNPDQNFYINQELTEKVQRDLEDFKSFASSFSPKWISEINSVQKAIEAESQKRRKTAVRKDLLKKIWD